MGQRTPFLPALRFVVRISGKCTRVRSVLSSDRHNRLLTATETQNSTRRNSCEACIDLGQAGVRIPAPWNQPLTLKTPHSVSEPLLVRCTPPLPPQGRQQVRSWGGGRSGVSSGENRCSRTGLRGGPSRGRGHATLCLNRALDTPCHLLRGHSRSIRALGKLSSSADVPRSPGSDRCDPKTRKAPAPTGSAGFTLSLWREVIKDSSCSEKENSHLLGLLLLAICYFV